MARWPRAEVSSVTGRSNALLDTTLLPLTAPKELASSVTTGRRHILGSEYGSQELNRSAEVSLCTLTAQVPYRSLKLGVAVSHGFGALVPRELRLGACHVSIHRIQILR